MPELNDSMLGTPPTSTILYAVHRTGSRLIGDRFLASNLADCLQIVDDLGAIPDPGLNQALAARVEGNTRWAAEMKAEEYHRINVLSFLSFWAAQEAGNENIVAAILRTVQPAAISASEKFPVGKYSVSHWPWPEEQCLEIAQKLDQKAKEKTPDGGWDVAARLTTLYGWLGATVTFSSATSEKFNEASLVRNVLLHRYGRLGQRDIARTPHLAEHLNNAIHLTRARLEEYFRAVVEVHIATMEGITAAGWK